MSIIYTIRCSCDDQTHAPYIGDDGIYVPYVVGDRVYDQMIISKEMFIEAYEKWIGGKKDE